MSIADTALLLLATGLALATGYLLGRRRRGSEPSPDDRAARDAFLSNLAHELRTPLTAMLGYAEIAAQERISERRRDEFTRRVLNHGRLLLRLVNDVFDYARLRDGDLRIHPIPVEPRTLVRELDRDLRPEADRKGLILSTTVDDSVPMCVEVDPDRVAQILRCLLHNAVKFTRRGNVQLHVTALEGNQQLVFEVQDSGPGIPEQMRARLFADLGKGDSSHARRHGGVGLGLALAKAVTRCLGGRLMLTDNGASGTTFRLVLPYARARSRDPVLAPALPRWSGTRMLDGDTATGMPTFSGTVLVVDDAADNRLLLRHALRKLGLHSEFAENGLVALRMLDQRHFDCVVMDMQMPVLDGYAATRSLRDRDDHTPVIALTAHALDGDREKCLAAGCDEFLTKPLDRSRLAETLGRLLAQQHA